MRRATALATLAPLRRCAIYTRKSTTMGLDQEFNTLDAQREACEQYILTQAGAGWQALNARYDDGGFTGANLDRPAFSRLLADIDAGEVDLVVCYKIDRLSRSLLDFATVMKRLNDAGVSFVSVTQNFSTADAVGRMTLNLLATFAEFEREMIAERTRDKMAASRRRGQWTGGPVPLGYQVVDKKLVVDELEAIRVREVFRLYLEHRACLVVVGILNESGQGTKRHLARSGRLREARAWMKSDVLRVLKNPVYAGYMSYGDERHEGEHQPIIDRETFETAQALLARRNVKQEKRSRNTDYLLTGFLFCSNCGSALTAASTRKGRNNYRYYRCVRRDKMGRKACPTRPVSAPRIEAFVVEQLQSAIAAGDLVHDLSARVDAEVAARRADLEVERRRLPTEIATLSAEGKRLVDKIGEVADGGKRLLDERLDEVGAQLQRLEGRLQEVEREIAALGATQVEAEWVRRCLADFAEIWDVLIGANRGRLLRAVVERVDYDGATGDVRVSLADLRSEVNAR
jgi:site-specific DNA recombinase